MPDRDNLPHNLDAERQVLGSCMLSQEALDIAVEVLKPEDFYKMEHRMTWNVITEMYNSDKAVDLTSVSDELQRRNMFDRFGGRTYLMELVCNVTTTLKTAYHVEVIRDYAIRRKLIEASAEMSKLAFKYDTEGHELLGEAEQILFDAFDSRDSKHVAGMSEISPLAFKIIDDAYHGDAKNVAGYSSGFSDLDGLINGFRPGSLNIIAARPSMGKTALAMNIAQFGGARGDNPCVLVFSLEMSAEQLAHRMYAASAKVNVSAMMRGVISEVEYSRLVEAEAQVRARNIYIHDVSDLTVTDFRAECRKFKMRHPDLALIVVDYLQLMRSGSKRYDNRQTEVAEISRAMKAVAKEMGCPVIALSQLSRETERRTDKKPQLWDLRDSGAIEQDADVVMMLYRESYYGDNENTDLMDDVAEIRVAKNRNGATGVCRLVFQREYTRFVNFMEE